MYIATMVIFITEMYLHFNHESSFCSTHCLTLLYLLNFYVLKKNYLIPHASIIPANSKF